MSNFCKMTFTGKVLSLTKALTAVRVDRSNSRVDLDKKTALLQPMKNDV